MQRPDSSSPSRPAVRRRLLAALPAIVASLAIVSSAAAHDFWLIPDMFGFAEGSTVHVNGRSGTRFPAGSAVQPARVAEARIIGSSSDVKITEMAVEGTALRLHQKPATAGQYLVVAALTPPLRYTRVAPAGLMRWLRAEGGSAEAARLERDGALMAVDTVAYASRSFASTILQLGAGGPRAFSKTAGYPLEFVPLNDPAHVHVGDTLHVRVLGDGKAVPAIGIDATPAADTTAAAGTTPASQMVALIADANGVVHLPLTKAGAWMLRSAYVSKRAGGPANEFDIARSTYTFSVGERAAARRERVPPDTVLRAEQIVVAGSVRALFAAAERKDLAALDTLYAGDSLTVVEGAGINRGWVDYRDNHIGPELKQFANFRYRPYEIQVRVAGPLAWAIFQYALSADAGERKIDVVGRGTAILERRGARWVVRHTQTTSRARRPTDPPMP